MSPTLSFLILSQFFFLFVSAEYSLKVASITVKVDDFGSYDILFDDTLWFSSGPTGLFENSQWSLNTDGTLDLTYVSPFAGQDQFGVYDGLTLFWTSLQGTTFGTRFRVYANFVIFDQFFPQGANGVDSSSNTKVSTSFPSISATAAKVPNLRYMSFQGNMAQPYYGVGLSNFTGGIYGGVPTVFYEEYEVAILSPMDNYFVGFHTVNQADLGSFLTCGIQGMVKEIPAGFVHPTILYYGQDGMNATMSAWGEILLKKTGKVRSTPSADFSIAHLGYWTDNGAYYYYWTEDNSTYEETMLLIKQYYEEEGVPIRYYQLDSWWYYKDQHDAVTVWTARPDIFPSSMTGFVKQLQDPLVLHNRFWSTSSPYQDLFNWASDLSYWGDAGYGLPNDTMFWDFFLSNLVLEFDHL